MKKGDQNFRKNYFAGPASVALISRLLIMEIKCQINRKFKMFPCYIFVFMREHLIFRVPIPDKEKNLT